MFQLNVTAVFYLADSRRIYPGRREESGVARQCMGWGGGREREYARVGERERERGPFGSSFICFFLPPGPAPCKLSLGRSAVLPEVLTPVLGPPFDLPLLYFHGLFPSCLLATTIVNSFSLF